MNDKLKIHFYLKKGYYTQKKTPSEFQAKIKLQFECDVIFIDKASFEK